MIDIILTIGFILVFVAAAVGAYEQFWLRRGASRISLYLLIIAWAFIFILPIVF
jgi:hypothetical protein